MKEEKKISKRMKKEKKNQQKIKIKSDLDRYY